MEDSAYKCPKEGCNKTFRKENLLQMHIKHYHPEYSKFLGSTPKVEDLAYARTIGESIEDIIPKKLAISSEKISKSGKRKSSQEKPLSTLLQSLNTAQSNHSPSIPIMSSGLETDIDQLEKCNNLHKDDAKIRTMSPMSNRGMKIEDDNEKKRENNCAMSPGTLFDMRVKEEKVQVGIKTLLPVRPAEKIDKAKCLNVTLNIERLKGHRKRQSTDYGTDLPTKERKRHGNNFVYLLLK